MGGLITIRDLKSVGRVGNQLFLYCFAKGYARAINCDLEVGDWIGRKIFMEANEPLPSRELPQTTMDTDPHNELGYFFGRKDIDIKSFCQHQKFLDFYSRADVRRWLKVKPEFEAYAPHDAVYSACHLRRGDYVTDPKLRQLYCEVSERSYDRAIKQFEIPDPVFKVTEGWRPTYHELDQRGLAWLPDWLFLRNATYLLRGNSSFSVFASWCGNGTTYSPIIGSKVGLQDCEFVEGNHEQTANFRNQSSLRLNDALCDGSGMTNNNSQR